MTVDLLRDYGRIDSPILVVSVLTVVVVWLWRRPDARAPRQLLLGFVALYWLLASRFGAALLALGIAGGFAPLRDLGAARGADAVVVLGGGAATYSQGGAVVGALTTSSLLRVLEAARIAKAIDARIVVVSGGTLHPGIQLEPESVLLRDALVQAGVPPDRVVQDAEARTTRDHPRTLGPILRQHHAGRFVLVTSPAHMRRALAVFRAAGLDPAPSASLYWAENRPPPPWIVPTSESLFQSYAAMYEYAAWVYYKANGWM